MRATGGRAGGIFDNADPDTFVCLLVVQYPL
jgi:hypothetical protein